MSSEEDTSSLLESWGMPSIVIARFEIMQVTSDLFPFLTESDLKELMLRTATRAKFRLHVHEMVKAKNNVEKQRMINSAVASLSQVIAQSSVPKAANNAVQSAADASFETSLISPVSPNIMPSADDIAAINLAADGHVCPPNYKTLAVLGAIEASVAKRSNAYAEEDVSAGQAAGTICASADSASQYGVSTLPYIMAGRKLSRGRRQRHQQQEIPVDQMMAGPSSVSHLNSSPIIQSATETSEEFAAALTLSLFAVQNQRLREPRQLTPILEDIVRLSPPSHMERSFEALYRDERLPTSIPKRLFSQDNQYKPMYSSRRSAAPIMGNETLYEELTPPSEHGDNF